MLLSMQLEQVSIKSKSPKEVAGLWMKQAFGSWGGKASGLESQQHSLGVGLDSEVKGSFVDDIAYISKRLAMPKTCTKSAADLGG